MEEEGHADDPKAQTGAGEVLPPEVALEAIEKRKLLKALRREGEPESPAGAYEPKDVELHGSVMKFHCRCGKRIAAPVDAKKAIGRCPKCGARIVLPKPTMPAREDVRSAALRAAVSDAADRLRGSHQVATAGVVGIAPLGVRAAAFLLDAMLVWSDFAVGVLALGNLWPGIYKWFASGALASLTWVVNRIVLPRYISASIGMLATGLRFERSGGVPNTWGASVLRACAGVALLPLAPMALKDPEGLTPADRLAGTRVVRGGHSLHG